VTVLLAEQVTPCQRPVNRMRGGARPCRRVYFNVKALKPGPTLWYEGFRGRDPLPRTGRPTPRTLEEVVEVSRGKRQQDVGRNRECPRACGRFALRGGADGVCAIGGAR